MQLILYDLPKISLNEWYSGKHWSERKTHKDNYKLIIRSQFKEVLQGKFDVSYSFYFKSNPLDASNCVAMVKLIEDVIFKKDGFSDVLSIKISSRKSEIKKDYVEINLE